MHLLFKHFKFNSLFVKDEVAEALLRIKDCCLKLDSIVFLKTSFQRGGVHIDEFKNTQESFSNAAIDFVRTEWTKQIK